MEIELMELKDNYLVGELLGCLSPLLKAKMLGQLTLKLYSHGENMQVTNITNADCV
jgi:hypothetical protein